MQTRLAAVESVTRAAPARRAASFAESPWAELDRLAARHPDMVFFGGGTPAREMIPLERLREASARAWEDAPVALDYGEVAGYRPLRELIATRMGARAMAVAPEQIVVTVGSQQGIDLIARLMLDPGDAIVVEAPTYIGALQAFDAYELIYLPVPVDDEGLCLDALEQTLRASPRPPKLLYTVPTFQNPTGTTLSHRRRRPLLDLARDHKLLIVEDDPYGELYCDEPPPPPLRALSEEVVYLGTFSKTIAPGLRVGWMAAPAPLIPLLENAREAIDVCTTRIATRIAYHTAVDFLDAHVAGARTFYRRRRDTLLAALETHMPDGVRWSRPGGGFFAWVELPGSLRAEEMLPRAAEQGVVYIPGAWCHPRSARGSHHALRLNFSTLPEARIVEGVRRLGEVIADSSHTG